MTAYLVTLRATATKRVWVEADSANDARLIAEAGDGKEHDPWKPENNPRTAKVERL